MRDSATGAVIAYNGEVYNCGELRRELEAGGVRFQSGSDTEVVLQAWIRWGDSAVERLEGIFAFVIVDEARRRSFMARDRMGIKPLYWAEDNGAILAASAPRALLALEPGLRDPIDTVALAQYLTLLWIPHPRTPWARIKKLPPGCAMSVSGGSWRQWRYWWPPAGSSEELRPDQLCGALEDATRRQLLSDVPVGLLFSGGLDSSLLLAFMRRHYEGELPALTAGYSSDRQRLEIAPDDLIYAREVAAMFGGIDLREVVVGNDPLPALDALAMHFDDPVGDPAALTLFDLVGSSDAKVLLSGVGGEELFAGYSRHVNLPVARRAARLPQGARAAGLRFAPALWGGRPGAAFGRRRNIQKLLRAVGGVSGEPHYWRMVSYLTAAEVESILPGSSEEAFAELDEMSVPLRGCTLREALQFDREQFLPNLNLAYVDKAAMARGVEVRVPILDEEIVRLAVSADAGRFIQASETKVPLRRCGAGVLPESVVRRAKSGFGGPVRSWFQGPEQHELTSRISALAKSGLVDGPGALHVAEAARSGTVDLALPAWGLVCLQAWESAYGS